LLVEIGVDEGQSGLDGGELGAALLNHGGGLGDGALDQWPLRVRRDDLRTGGPLFVIDHLGRGFAVLALGIGEGQATAHGAAAGVPDGPLLQLAGAFVLEIGEALFGGFELLPGDVQVLTGGSGLVAQIGGLVGEIAAGRGVGDGGRTEEYEQE
jgi:hypothetical protein